MPTRSELLYRESVEVLKEWMEEQNFSSFKQGFILMNTSALNDYKATYVRFHNEHSIDSIIRATHLSRLTRMQDDEIFHELQHGTINARTTERLSELISEREQLMDLYNRLTTPTGMLEVEPSSQMPEVDFDDTPRRVRIPRDVRINEVSGNTARGISASSIEFSNEVLENISAGSSFIYEGGGVDFNMPMKKQKRKISLYDRAVDLIKDGKFPRPNFTPWDNRDSLESMIDDWYANAEFRHNWIFYRREREGFNRRGIERFDITAIEERMSKRRKPHELDTEQSKFYDWVLGGTNWILRLELFTLEDITFVISRYINKTNNKEVKYDVKFWTGSKFDDIFSFWAEWSEDRINGNVLCHFQGERRYSADDIEDEYEEEVHPWLAVSYSEDDEEYENGYDEDIEDYLGDSDDDISF